MGCWPSTMGTCSGFDFVSRQVAYVHLPERLRVLSHGHRLSLRTSRQATRPLPPREFWRAGATAVEQSFGVRGARAGLSFNGKELVGSALVHEWQV